MYRPQTGSYGRLPNWDTAYNWEVLITLENWDGVSLPISDPDIEGLFMKVFKETESVVRCFVHFPSAVRRTAAVQIVPVGCSADLKPWTGPFWPKVNSQRIAKKIWELGPRPQFRSGNTKKRKGAKLSTCIQPDSKQRKLF